MSIIRFYLPHACQRILWINIKPQRNHHIMMSWAVFPFRLTWHPYLGIKIQYYASHVSSHGNGYRVVWFWQSDLSRMRKFLLCITWYYHIVWHILCNIIKGVLYTVIQSLWIRISFISSSKTLFSFRRKIV